MPAGRGPHRHARLGLHRRVPHRWPALRPGRPGRRELRRRPGAARGVRRRASAAGRSTRSRRCAPIPRSTWSSSPCRTTSTSRRSGRPRPTARASRARSRSGANADRGGRDAPPRRRRPGVFNAYLENVVFTAEMIRMREMIEAGAIGRLDDVPGARGPQRPARRALLGRRAGRRRRAPRHGLARHRGGPLPVRQGRRRSATCSPGARRSSTATGRRGEDNAVMLVRFEDDRVATMDVSWSSKGGLENRFEAYGDAGRIVEDITSTLAARLHRAAGRLPRREGRCRHRLGLPGPGRDLRPRPRRDDAPRRRGVPRRRRAARDVPGRVRRQRDHRRRLPLDARAATGSRSSPERAAAGATATAAAAATR